MARRGRKKTLRDSPPKSEQPDQVATHVDQHPHESELDRVATHTDKEAFQFIKKHHTFINREVERRITAIKAINNAETESLLSRLRFLRSRFTNEQLQRHALQFFREDCPNLSIVKNEKYPIFELERRDYDICLNNVPGSDTIFPSTGGFQFSSRSVKADFLKIGSLHVPNYVLDELSETLFPTATDSLRTPGVTAHRLSVGMTPKTQRPPKHGEVLLSAHGSPLGVYREENLEAIHETDDGSHEGGDQQ